MIYVKTKKKPDTLDELFKVLFSYRNEGYYTLYKSCITYHDAEYNKVECMSNKYRSIDDIIIIARTYFPNATEKEIFQSLFDLTLEHEDSTYHLSTHNCDEIKRPTVCFRKPSEVYIAPFRNDEWTENSDYTWEYFFNTLGISNKDEAKKLLQQKAGVQ